MTTGSVPDTCGTCRYRPDRECVRFPPAVMVGGQAWPRMNSDDWCGEHEAKAEPPAKPVGFAPPVAAAAAGKTAPARRKKA